MVVGLATHLDGRLYIKRQCLVLLEEGAGRGRIDTSYYVCTFTLTYTCTHTHTHMHTHAHTYTHTCTKNTHTHQAHGWKEDGEVQHIPFPFDDKDEEVPLPEGK